LAFCIPYAGTFFAHTVKEPNIKILKTALATFFLSPPVLNLTVPSLKSL
jgi:hypothetical protein